jgi:hypothetical protein
MGRKTQVDASNTDFKKASDKLNHSILVKKLIALGFHGNLLHLRQSPMIPWKENSINCSEGFLISTPVTMTSRVPQGSHLSPLLFVIFINELARELSSPCLLYADDLKIFRAVNTIEDCIVIQKDLNNNNLWVVYS